MSHTATEKKIQRLKKIVSSMGSVLVAYSGGLDSSFLLFVAHECLGEKVLAVTALSQTYTKAERSFARKFCGKYGIRHRFIRTRELGDGRFRANPRNRCYFCKKELFGRLQAIAKKEHYGCVIDATNDDDRRDVRPGTRAKKELKVRSPLAEARIGKQEIRLVSKAMGLPSWNLPQMACLASRINYGSVITQQRLARIEKAENFLRKHFHLEGNIRVRDYGLLARIEVDKEHIPALLSQDGFVRRFKRLGFKYITVDLEGFRSGSMNGG